MGLEFLDRVRRTSIVSALPLSLVFWAYMGPAQAGAFLLGCAWSLVNIHVLRVLVRLVSDDPGNHKLRIAGVFVVKLPVLYSAGYVLLAVLRFPPMGLLAGFIWPLSVIVLKAAGRFLLGLDEEKRTLTGSTTGGIQKNS